MATSVKLARPPATVPKPTTAEEALWDLHRRFVRVETRLGRLMQHFGLDSRGDPIPVKQPE